RLARQVAALKAADLATRLAHAQSQARELAKQEQGLSEKSQDKEGDGKGEGKDGDQKQAAKQHGLSEEGRTLEDLVEQLQADAAEADAKLGQALRQAKEANPPSEIVKQMQQAAEAFQAGRRDRARREAGQAADKLDALAQQLDVARREFMQPQLGKLLAAEKQAAEAQQALKSANNEAQKAAAEKKLTDVRDAMQALNSTDGKMAEATAALAEALRNGGAWRERDKRRPEETEGLYQPPPRYESSIQRVVQALQAKIQEIILKDALLDRDEAVPPQFR